MGRLLKLTKQAIRRILQVPEGVRIATAAQLVILRLITQSPLLTALYYYSKGTYHFEQRGSLLGRLLHLDSIKAESGIPIYLLIKNVHSLERGLCVKEGRRPVFAEGYILPTVRALEKVVRNQSADEQTPMRGTIAWAFDVIARYFQVTESTPKIQSAEEIFQQLLELTSYKPGNRFPYPRGLISDSPVSYGALKRLAAQRRSVRWYQRRPVNRADIDRAIEVAILSPSACNRQPFQFLVFDDPELVQEISKMSIGINGFSPNIPVIVAVVSKLRAYFDEGDRHLLYIDSALAVMSFMYALETLGLSSCPINWPAIEESEKRIAALLGLGPDERVIMLITLGYADPEGMIAYSQRKSLDKVRQYNLA